MSRVSFKSSERGTNICLFAPNAYQYIDTRSPVHYHRRTGHVGTSLAISPAKKFIDVQHTQKSNLLFVIILAERFPIFHVARRQSTQTDVTL